MISILQKASSHLMFAAVLLLTPFFVQAQDAVSYTVSPTIFDMTANPGQTFKSTVRIINTNPFELRVYIDKNNFVPKGEEGVPQFLPLDPNRPQNTLAEWITTEQALIIAPEQTVELPFQITVPTDAAPGGHFAAILISTKPPADSDKDTKVKTAQTISSLLFLRVTGDITENSAVRSFRTSHYFLSQPEATFELRIENKGNVHVQPQGEIKIYNMWGKERGTVPVNQYTLFGNVLPNSVRKYSFTWSSEWSITDIGRYTAVATLAYGVDTRQFMTADTAFWIIPWKFLLTIIVVVGGFIALVTWAIKAYVRRMLALAGVTPSSNVMTQSTEPVPKGRSKKTKAETVKETTKRVTAPIEVGILDLRGKLQGKEAFKERALTILSFVRLQWKFFAVAAAIILFIILSTLFFKGAFQSSREYQVTIESPGQNVTVTGGATIDTTPSEAPVATTTSTTTISLINRSGSDTLLVEVAERLQTAGHVITNKETETGIEDKTVIVYSPKDADLAFRLSQLLEGALLSAYSDGNETQTIIIYIGSDLETVD